MTKGHVFLGVAVIMIFGALSTIFGGFFIVDQGERAVVLRWGEVKEIASPGMNFKVPWMDTAKKMSVQTNKMLETLSVYSKDVQSAHIVVSVNYSLSPDKVSEIYTRLGMDYESRLIRPQILDKVKNSFGKYAAVDIVRNREVLALEMVDGLQGSLANAGIIVESIQIENIDFSDAYERSVEERMEAEVKVQKVVQDLEREKLNAEIIRTTAQGTADAQLTQARAEAEAIRIKGLAEAEAIQAKSKAIAANPRYVELVQAEKWNGALPQTMIPSSTLPVISPR